MFKQVFQVQQRFLEMVHPHHPLISRGAVGVQIDTHHIHSGCEQSVDRQAIAKQLGAHMDAAHVGAAGHGHDPLELRMKLGIASAAQRQQNWMVN